MPDSRFYFAFNGIDSYLSVPTVTPASSVFIVSLDYQRESDASVDCLFSGMDIRVSWLATGSSNYLEFTYRDTSDVLRTKTFTTISQSVGSGSLKFEINETTSEVTATLGNVSETLTIDSGQEIKSVDVSDFAKNVSGLSANDYFNGSIYNINIEDPYAIQPEPAGAAQETYVREGNGVDMYGSFNDIVIPNGDDWELEFDWIADLSGINRCIGLTNSNNSRFYITGIGIVGLVDSNGVSLTLPAGTVKDQQHLRVNTGQSSGTAFIKINGVELNTSASLSINNWQFNTLHKHFAGYGVGVGANYKLSVNGVLIRHWKMDEPDTYAISRDYTNTGDYEVQTVPDVEGVPIGGNSVTNYPTSLYVEEGKKYHLTADVTDYSGTETAGVNAVLVDDGTFLGQLQGSRAVVGGGLSFSFVSDASGYIQFFTRTTNTANFRNIKLVGDYNAILWINTTTPIALPKIDRYYPATNPPNDQSATIVDQYGDGTTDGTIQNYDSGAWQ